MALRSSVGFVVGRNEEGVEGDAGLTEDEVADDLVVVPVGAATLSVVSLLYTIRSSDVGLLSLSRPLVFETALSPGLAEGIVLLSGALMFKPALSPGSALWTRWWCISAVET